MLGHKITINGQQYDSPEAMPPDVRHTYEEAMRMLASRAGGGTTQVFTGHAGGVDGSVVINRTVTVNNQTFGSLDQLPPETRRQVEEALSGAAPKASPKTALHLSLNLEAHRRGASDPPPAFDSTSTEAKIRDIPFKLAILVGIALFLWLTLGR